MYDIFEPSYIEPAFRCKDTNLGHLIWGHDDWKRLSGELKLPFDAPNNEEIAKYQCAFIGMYIFILIY